MHVAEVDIKANQQAAEKEAEPPTTAAAELEESEVFVPEESAAEREATVVDAEILALDSSPTLPTDECSSTTTSDAGDEIVPVEDLTTPTPPPNLPLLDEDEFAYEDGLL